jgi:6-phospho-beta-glucosidase
VIGICDSPVGLCRRVAAALGVAENAASFDYVGLNHLGWLRAVTVNGRDRLPALFEDVEVLTSFEEGKLFGAQWLRTLRSVPNEYLHYYYFARETLEQMRAQDTTRGEFLRSQQRTFYERIDQDPSAALRLWQETRSERENTYAREARAISGMGERAACDMDGGGYEQVALRLMNSIAGNRSDTLILNVRNRGVVAGMPEDAVVEVPTFVDANGPRPLGMRPLDPHSLGLMLQVKATERATIRAATTRSRSDALFAIATHPLVDSVAAAAQSLADYAAAFPDLAKFA